MENSETEENKDNKIITETEENNDKKIITDKLAHHWHWHYVNVPDIIFTWKTLMEISIDFF